MKAQAVRYVLDDVVPESLACPITQGLMRNPVRIPGDSQHVFERTSALAWLKRQNTNPFTRGKVLPGPLLRAPHTQRQAADLVQETGRFYRAFGDRHEGAARTIQAAWLRYTAERPAGEFASLRAYLDDAAQIKEFAASVADHVREVPYAVRAATDLAARAKQAAADAERIPDNAGHQVDWTLLAQTHPRWAERLRAVVERPSVQAITLLHDECQAQGEDFAALMLAQDAAPLRALLHLGGLTTLAECAPWLPEGTYGSMVLRRNLRAGTSYVGETVVGEAHGLGICSDDDGQRYGTWEHGQLSGLGVDRAGGVCHRGLFVDGEPECGTLEDGPMRMAACVQDGVRWGESASGKHRIVGALGPEGPKQCWSRESDGREIVTQQVTHNGTVLGRIDYGDGRVYAGELDTAVPHGRGVLRGPEGRSLIGHWRDEQPVGVVVRELPDGSQELLPLDPEATEALWTAAVEAGLPQVQA